MKRASLMAFAALAMIASQPAQAATPHNPRPRDLAEDERRLSAATAKRSHRQRKRARMAKLKGAGK